MAILDWFPNKYYIVIMKQRSDDKVEYDEQKRIRVDPLKDQMVFKDKTFTYSLKEFVHTKGRRHMCYKDYDNGDTIFQWGTTANGLPVDGIKQKNKERLMDKAMQVNPHDYGLAMVIIAALAGLAGGAVIMVVAYPTIFPNMIKPVEKAAQAILCLL